MLRRMGAGRLLVGGRFLLRLGPRGYESAAASHSVSPQAHSDPVERQKSGSEPVERQKSGGNVAGKRAVTRRDSAAKGGLPWVQKGASRATMRRPQHQHQQQEHQQHRNQPNGQQQRQHLQHHQLRSPPPVGRACADAQRTRGGKGEHHLNKRKKDSHAKDMKTSSGTASSQRHEFDSDGPPLPVKLPTADEERPPAVAPPVEEESKMPLPVTKLQPVLDSRSVPFTGRVAKYYAWKEAKAAPRTSPGGDWWKPEKVAAERAAPIPSSAPGQSTPFSIKHAAEGESQRLDVLDVTFKSAPRVSSMLPQDDALQARAGDPASYRPLHGKDVSAERSSTVEGSSSTEQQQAPTNVDESESMETSGAARAKQRHEENAAAAQVKREEKTLEEERVLQMKDWTPTQVLTELKAVGMEPSVTVFRRLLSSSLARGGDPVKELLIALLKQSQTQASRKTVPVCAHLLQEASEALNVYWIPGALERIAKLTYAARKHVTLTQDNLLTAIEVSNAHFRSTTGKNTVKAVLKLALATGKRAPAVCIAAGDACAKFDPALSWNFYCKAASRGGLDRMPAGFPQLLNNCIIERDFELASRVHTAMALMPVSTKFDRRHLVNTYLCMERTDLAVALLEGMPREFLEKQWFFDFAKMCRSLAPKTKIDLQPVLDALSAKGVGKDSISGLRMSLLGSAISNDFDSALKTLQEAVASKHPHAASGLAFLAWMPLGTMRAQHVKELLLLAKEIRSLGLHSEYATGPEAVQRSLVLMLRGKNNREAAEIIQLLVDLEKMKLEGIHANIIRLPLLLHQVDWTVDGADSVAHASLELAALWSSPRERQLRLYTQWVASIAKAGLTKGELSQRFGSVLEYAAKTSFELPSSLQKMLHEDKVSSQ